MSQRIAHRQGVPKDSTSLSELQTFLRDATTAERIHLERSGVSSHMIEGVIKETGLAAQQLQRLFGLSRATFVKKLRDKAIFNGVPGQSTLALVDLINEAEDMLAVGDLDANKAQDFNLKRWVGMWIQTPQPALGGRRPAELMDTPSGRTCVLRLMGAIQSGAYQ